MDKATQNQIRAAGIVQAVIASGAPPEQWAKLTAHGLKMSKAFAERLGGAKSPFPKWTPIKESN